MKNIHNYFFPSKLSCTSSCASYR